MKDGYFDDVKREFVITNMKPRRLWYNYLWNEEMICVCDQFGAGNSFGTFDGNKRTIEAYSLNPRLRDTMRTVTEIITPNTAVAFTATRGLRSAANIPKFSSGAINLATGTKLPINTLKAFITAIIIPSDCKKTG